MSKRSKLGVAVLGLCAAVTAAAMTPSVARADGTLKMGDDAPALAVGQFVKGEPVKAFEKGKIYVVEFWATWCPPCRESIPHLTEMQKAHPDVTFIGCDVGEDAEKVKPFVEKMGGKMDYRVAIDDLTTEGGKTNAAYMTAAGQNGIPTAFVIDKDSKVAWIGHPMAMAEPLKQIIAGTYDAKKAAAAAASKEKLGGLLQAGDFDGALKAADGIAAADPGQAGAMGVLQFQVLLQGKHDTPAAVKKADEIATKVDDAGALNMMAWTLVTTGEPTADAVATAQKLADAAVAKEPGNAQIIDTAARVAAVKKDYKKAAELETTAIAKCTEDGLKAEFEKSLSAYKAEKLPDAQP